MGSLRVLRALRLGTTAKLPDTGTESMATKRQQDQQLQKTGGAIALTLDWIKSNHPSFPRSPKCFKRNSWTYWNWHVKKTSNNPNTLTNAIQSNQEDRP
jgi:hypothetical protein